MFSRLRQLFNFGRTNTATNTNRSQGRGRGAASPTRISSQQSMPLAPFIQSGPMSSAGSLTAGNGSKQSSSSRGAAGGAQSNHSATSNSPNSPKSPRPPRPPLPSAVGQLSSNEKVARWIGMDVKASDLVIVHNPPSIPGSTPGKIPVATVPIRVGGCSSASSQSSSSSGTRYAGVSGLSGSTGSGSGQDVVDFGGPASPSGNSDARNMDIPPKPDFPPPRPPNRPFKTPVQPLSTFFEQPAVATKQSLLRQPAAAGKKTAAAKEPGLTSLQSIVGENYDDSLTLFFPSGQGADRLAQRLTVMLLSGRTPGLADIRVFDSGEHAPSVHGDMSSGANRLMLEMVDGKVVGLLDRKNKRVSAFMPPNMPPKS